MIFPFVKGKRREGEKARENSVTTRKESSVYKSILPNKRIGMTTEFLEKKKPCSMFCDDFLPVQMISN